MAEDVFVELTPEEELAQREAVYGIFARANIDVDHVAETVTVTMDSPLKGKDKVTIVTDTANAAAWIFNDVFRPIEAAAKKVQSFQGK